MGFDPMADLSAAPSQRSDSTLRIAEEAGIGTSDPGNIDVAGVSILEARAQFRRAPKTLLIFDRLVANGLPAFSTET